MRSLIRWSTALAIVGSVLVGSLFVGNSRVLALPDDEVKARLDTVPVFTLVDASGSLVVATFTEEQNTPPVATVFISHENAENFLRNMGQNSPESVEGVRIVPISLARVYEIALAGQDENNPLQVAFIPERQEVDAAVSILQQNGQDVNAQDFRGVPLFIAKSGEGDQESLLTIQRGEEQVIPMYFSEEELQAALSGLRESQPDLASSVRIDVVTLDRLIENLRSSDNQELNQIYLVPPQESIEFIRSMQQEGGRQQPAPQATPQPQSPQPAPQPQ
jgi:nickel transport protein